MAARSSSPAARPSRLIAPSLLLAAYGLTPAQCRVARLVLHGRTTGQIVVDLHISAHTVQDHLKAVFDKVGVRSRRIGRRVDAPVPLERQSGDSACLAFLAVGCGSLGSGDGRRIQEGGLAGGEEICHGCGVGVTPGERG